MKTLRFTIFGIGVIAVLLLAACAPAAAVPTSAVLTNVRRDNDLLLITAFFLRGISDLC